MKRLAVVGAGLSGLTMIRTLLQDLDEECSLREVHLFDSASPGSGTAFASVNDSFLFNTLPDKTCGTHVDQPLEFVNWLRKTKPDYQEGTYVPRSDYRLYLESTVPLMRELANQLGIDFQFHRARVTEVTYEDGQYFIRSDEDGDDVLAANWVVLALGNLTKQPYPKLLELPSYVPLPYSGSELSSLEGRERILIIGSRLSAVDILVGLHDQGHRGLISVVSPSGELNTVKDRFEYSPRTFTEDHFRHVTSGWTKPLKLETFNQIFLDEMKLAYGSTEAWEKQLSYDRSPYEKLCEDIQLAKEKENYAYATLVSSLGFSEALFRSLSLLDRTLFFQQHRSLFTRFIAPLPLVSAVKVQSLFEAGRLEVIGGLKGVEILDQRRFKLQIDHHCWEFEFDMVFNASGFIRRVDRSGHELLDHLLHHNLIEVCERGGIAFNRENMGVRGQKGLYILGDLARGERFPVNITPYLVHDAVKAARDLKNQVGLDGAFQKANVF